LRFATWLKFMGMAAMLYYTSEASTVLACLLLLPDAWAAVRKWT